MNKKKTPISKIIVFVLVLALFFPTLPTWWANKAQIPLFDDCFSGKCFWGDDVISQFFKGIANNLVIPVWNTLSANDTIRGIVTLILLGFLTALGTDLYKRYKATQKEEE